MTAPVVASVLHYGYDENGALVAKFKCRSTQCANVTVSAADAEGTRTITLQGTLLQAVNADGTLSTTDSELINAALTLAVPEAPPVITCNAGDPGFTVTVTGQPALRLCVPIRHRATPRSTTTAASTTFLPTTTR